MIQIAIIVITVIFFAVKAKKDKEEKRRREEYMKILQIAMVQYKKDGKIEKYKECKRVLDYLKAGNKLRRKVVK